MSRQAAKGMRRNGAVRCAIYTRKSSEEGLEQEFNSLQAQREACEAFIKSQRHEGWVCVPDGYDDGGLSGATMDRTAFVWARAPVLFLPVGIQHCGDITRRWSRGIRNRGPPNDNGREARPDLLVLFARRNEAGEQDSA